GDPAKLLKSFRERFSAGELDIAKDGRIELPAVTASATEAGGKATVLLDPSQFDAHFFDELSAADLSDGLPVIAPTEKRVKDMLAFSDLDPDHALVNELPPSGATITVRALAANAAMAGCKPEYFPILVAAMQAMADPLYRLFQGAITTFAGGNALMVSGP